VNGLDVTGAAMVGGGTPIFIYRRLLLSTANKRYHTI
jgi:hypothetical protein